MFKWLINIVLTSASIGVLAEPAATIDVRDPTTPLGQVTGVGTTAASEWVLDSVLISPKRKLAVINGQTIREGEIIPGSNAIKIQHILPQSVVLQQGEKSWVLTMSPGVVKKH